MRLIVANQTLGGAALDRTIREHIDAGESDFFIVVPTIEPRYETHVWAVADVGFAVPPLESEMAEAMEEAQRRSEHRLTRMVEKIEAAGGRAEGEVGAADPVEAVCDVLERQHIEEIIVSTLPAGISRWLKLDLPSRIGRATDVPVTTVEAER